MNRRTACALLLVAWGWSLLLFLVILIAPLASPLAGECDFQPGDSGDGDSSWSWLPPGQVCTYTEIDEAGGSAVHAEGPGVDRWLAIALLILFPVAPIMGLSGSKAQAADRWGDRG